MRTKIGIVRRREGQSLILALTVMFLLLFLAGVFVALVARNLTRAQRSGETLTAEYLAEVGIRYADHQLTYSEDGADWRPVPSYPEVVRKISAGQNPETLPADQKPDPRDPDYKWLISGFSRYNYGQGRFLLRVTYEPKLGGPMSKLIKIESIGRMGLVNPDYFDDPTTMTSQPPHLRSELVAYKPITLTDYARFITNKDRRTGVISLGTPNFATSFGERTKRGGKDVILGAPIRVNGDLQWHGKNFIHLDASRGDVVEVAGDISHAVSATGQGQSGSEVTSVLVTSNPDPNSGYGRAYESNDPNFTTYPENPGDTNVQIGNYRDGRPVPDAQRRPREITRVEPPLIDVVGTASRLSRYRELTYNSGDWIDRGGGNWYNTGYYGWGRGIYIGNGGDVQTESEGYTLRSNWTQPGTEYWNGPYYTPPGVTITLFPYDLDKAEESPGVLNGPDMIITRDASSRFIWRDKYGNPLPATGEQIIMPYPKNGVIFAEGNIRIKGTLPPRTQLTVVSGGTIYIEGNLLRNPAEPESSAIALLAQDYVCVNTTQFFGPIEQIPMPGAGAEYFDVSPTNAFWFNFSFGRDPVQLYGRQTPVRLYTRHTAAPGGASYINMLINYPPTRAQLASNPYYSFYRFNIPGWAQPGVLPSQYNYPLGVMTVTGFPYVSTPGDPSGDASAQQYEKWDHAVFPLIPPSAGSEFDLHTEPGVVNRVGIQIDQSLPLAIPPQDCYVSRAFVAPIDIRIEALIYAQNGSFFVIPGPWCNPDPTDTRQNWINNGRRRPLGVNALWPFYGEPPDVRVILSGAISENLPAPIGDCSAWMEKWGWIPYEHGSSGEFADYRTDLLDPTDPSDDRRRGLTFVYDGQLSSPYDSAGVPVRVDDYGRTLPLLPKLPVSPQLLYFGEPA